MGERYANLAPMGMTGQDQLDAFIPLKLSVDIRIVGEHDDHGIGAKVFHGLERQ